MFAGLEGCVMLPPPCQRPPCLPCPAPPPPSHAPLPCLSCRSQLSKLRGELARLKESMREVEQQSAAKDVQVGGWWWRGGLPWDLSFTWPSSLGIWMGIQALGFRVGIRAITGRGGLANSWLSGIWLTAAA